MTGFEALIVRPIIDVLIGDSPIKNCTDFLSGQVSLPYLKGWQISEIGTTFGVRVSDGMGSGAPSRWVIMKSLMEKMNNLNRLPDLLSYIFQKSQFEDLPNQFSTPEQIDKEYAERVQLAIDAINKHLTLNDRFLLIKNKKFYHCCPEKLYHKVS